MAFQLLPGHFGVLDALALPHYDSGDKLLTLPHQSPREESTVDSVLGPTSHSIADANAFFCDKIGILAAFALILWDAIGFSYKTEIIRAI